MKTALLVVLLVAATVAYADPIDPGIIIGGGSGSFHVTSTPFFFSDADGSGPGTNCLFLGPGFSTGANPDPCVFFNATGFAWTTLDFFVVDPTLATLTVNCQANFFFTGCTATSLGGGLYQFSFFGGTWPVGSEGGEAVIDITTLGQWPTGTTFQAVANIPEPATMLLTATGLASFYLRRRLRKS